MRNQRKSSLITSIDVYKRQVHTRHIAVHRIIQAAAQEAAVIHQRAILPENIIVVVLSLIHISDPDPLTVTIRSVYR